MRWEAWAAGGRAGRGTEGAGGAGSSRAVRGCQHRDAPACRRPRAGWTYRSYTHHLTAGIAAGASVRRGRARTGGRAASSPRAGQRPPRPRTLCPWPLAQPGTAQRRQSNPPIPTTTSASLTWAAATFPPSAATRIGARCATPHRRGTAGAAAGLEGRPNARARDIAGGGGGLGEEGGRAVGGLGCAWPAASRQNRRCRPGARPADGAAPGGRRMTRVRRSGWMTEGAGVVLLGARGQWRRRRAAAAASARLSPPCPGHGFALRSGATPTPIVSGVRCPPLSAPTPTVARSLPSAQPPRSRWKVAATATWTRFTPRCRRSRPGTVSPLTPCCAAATSRRASGAVHGRAGSNGRALASHQPPPSSHAPTSLHPFSSPRPCAIWTTWSAWRARPSTAPSKRFTSTTRARLSPPTPPSLVRAGWGGVVGWWSWGGGRAGQAGQRACASRPPARPRPPQP